ncbi:WGxxGxxG family protein [Paenibacillus sp. sgz5001063]|uniref:WGxxGxxG family protein n=1 Tax=Paenibacillus sp. sgz5001063 TaxID=3242474 RepID=UPI0036D3BDDB
MNKLITSLACGTVLSMSLLGVGYASNASGTAGMGGTAPIYNGSSTNDRMGTGTRMMNEQGNTMLNNTTGTLRNNDTIMRDKVRTGDNSTVSPLSNTTQTGRYRATSTTTNATDNDNGSNWGWLGLVGLLGLAGMRNRSSERERR